MCTSVGRVLHRDMAITPQEAAERPDRIGISPVEVTRLRSGRSTWSGAPVTRSAAELLIDDRLRDEGRVWVCRRKRTLATKDPRHWSKAFWPTTDGKSANSARSTRS